MYVTEEEDEASNDDKESAAKPKSVPLPPEGLNSSGNNKKRRRPSQILQQYDTDTKIMQDKNKGSGEDGSSLLGPKDDNGSKSNISLTPIIPKYT